MASEEEVRAELDALTSRLASDSQGSIDHAVNARAIAIASPDVRQRLETALIAGDRLRNITPITGYGSSPLDFRLRLEFESPGAHIGVSTADFVVSVELPTKRVRRILEPTETAAPPTLAAPFSLTVPSSARELRTPTAEVAARAARTQAFLSARLPSARRARLFGDETQTPVTTYSQTEVESTVATNVGTDTETEGITDDSQNDVNYDSIEEYSQDSQTDYQNDYI